MPSPNDKRATARNRLCLLAVTLAAIVYFNALPNPFVYDDTATVVKNESIRSLNLLKIARHSLFRPVTNLSYAVDYSVWKLHPIGYHLSNILLHLVNVVLLFAWTRALVVDRLTSPTSHDAPADATLHVPFMAAALFAVHPLLTEAVGYVSGRSEVLCTTFFLTSLLLARRWLVTSKTRWLLAALGALLLAVGTKELGLMLPFVLITYDWLFPIGSTESRRHRFGRFHLPLVGLLLAFAVARTVSFLAVEVPIPRMPVWMTVLTQAGVIVRYIGLLVGPISQSLVHQVRDVADPLEPRAWLAVAALAWLAWFALRIRPRNPLITFGVLWFFLLLVPSSSVVPLQERMAEHRVYLASCGFFIAVAGCLERLDQWSLSRQIWPRRNRSLLFGVLVGALALLTISRNRVWASPVRLWQDAARKAPGVWIPQYAFGDALRDAGECERAIDQYRVAIRLRPKEPRAHVGLGICLGQLKQFTESEQAFRAALRIDPDNVQAWNDLGVLFTSRGRALEAETYFRKALEVDPDNTLARQRLVTLYEGTLDNPPEALRLCREIKILAPEAPGIDECVRRNQLRAPVRN